MDWKLQTEIINLDFSTLNEHFYLFIHSLIGLHNRKTYLELGPPKKTMLLNTFI